MRPLRVVVLAEPGASFEDWELRLFERLRSNPDLELVSFAAADSPQANSKRNWLLNRLLAFERATLLRGRRGARAVIPTVARHSGDAVPDADIYLSHVRGGWACLDDKEHREVWGYSVLTDGRWRTFGAAEVSNGSPVTKVELLRNLDGLIEPLDVSITNTKLFGAFNADYAKDKLVAIIDRALRRRSRGLVPAPKAPVQGNSTPPVNILQYATKTATGILRRAFGSIVRRFGGRPDEWTLLLGQGDVLLDPLTELIELPQPKSEFRADPFLFEHESQVYVFFEACPYASGKGGISVGRLEGTRLVDERPIDFGDIHLSFPFVFRDGSSIYMVPETHQRNRVEVWRATHFPDQWTLHGTALEGQAPADTTLFVHDGQWWLFTNLSSGAFEDHGQELHVFRVSGPDLQKLEPHKDNPVVIDSTSARNGGRPFHRGGELYRPAQMASHGQYGHGIKLTRITQLSLDAFCEVPALTITPFPSSGTTGCHHLDVSSDTFILDARRAFGHRILGAKPIRLRSLKERK